MFKINIAVKNLMKFVCLLTVIAYQPSATANEKFSEKELDKFIKKANYSGNILESDGVRSGIALANYQEGSKTDVLFAFQGVLCLGQLTGSIGRGTTKVKLTCSNDSIITGSGRIDEGGRGTFQLSANDGDANKVSIHFMPKSGGIKQLISTLFPFQNNTQKSETKVKNTTPSVTESLKLETLIKKAIRTSKQFRDCLSKTPIGEDKVNTAYYRNMSDTAFEVVKQAMKTDCVRLLDDVLKTNESRIVNAASVEKSNGKQLIDNDVNKTKPLSGHAFVSLELACSENKKGDKPYRDKIFGVISPYSFQGNSFWINRSKDYVGQKIYTGILTDTKLVLNAKGRRSDRPTKPWKFKLTSKGNLTIEQHLKNGLTGFEGKDQWKRDCKMTLLKMESVSDALNTKLFRQRIGSLEAEKSDLLQRYKNVEAELVESRLEAASKIAEIRSIANSLQRKEDESKQQENLQRITMIELEKLRSEILSKDSQILKIANNAKEIASKETSATQNLAIFKKQNAEFEEKIASSNKKIIELEKALAGERKARKLEKQEQKAADKDEKVKESEKINKLQIQVAELKLKNSELSKGLDKAKTSLQKKMSDIEREKKIKQELDKKLNSQSKFMKKIEISDVKWLEPVTELGDGFTSFEASQNNRLTVINMCLSNISNAAFKFRKQDTKIGLTLGNGKRSFSISEALEALVAQMEARLLPTDIQPGDTKCGHAVFETPIGFEIKKSEVFILDGEELVARHTSN